MNNYTGMPGLLSKWGYQTAFFHGANRGSMGFLAFANKIGFQNIMADRIMHKINASEVMLISMEIGASGTNLSCNIGARR